MSAPASPSSSDPLDESSLPLPSLPLSSSESFAAFFLATYLTGFTAVSCLASAFFCSYS